MKTFMAFAIFIMSTSAYAIKAEDGNNVDQWPAKTKATEYKDSISSGQASTIRSPHNVKIRHARCVDKRGYAYSKYDSGFAACVNEASERSKNR